MTTEQDPSHPLSEFFPAFVCEAIALDVRRALELETHFGFVPPQPPSIDQFQDAVLANPMPDSAAEEFWVNGILREVTERGAKVIDKHGSSALAGLRATRGDILQCFKGLLAPLAVASYGNLGPRDSWSRIKASVRKVDDSLREVSAGVRSLVARDGQLVGEVSILDPEDATSLEGGIALLFIHPQRAGSAPITAICCIQDVPAAVEPSEGFAVDAPLSPPRDPDAFALASLGADVPINSEDVSIVFLPKMS